MLGFYAHKVDDGRYEYGVIRETYETAYYNPYAGLRGGVEWVGYRTGEQYEMRGEAPDMNAALAAAETAASTAT